MIVGQLKVLQLMLVMVAGQVQTLLHHTPRVLVIILLVFHVLTHLTIVGHPTREKLHKENPLSTLDQYTKKDTVYVVSVAKITQARYKYSVGTVVVYNT